MKLLGLFSQKNSKSNSTNPSYLSSGGRKSLQVESLEQRNLLAVGLIEPTGIDYIAAPGETNDVQVDASVLLSIEDHPSVLQLPIDPLAHSEALEAISVSVGGSVLGSAPNLRHRAALSRIPLASSIRAHLPFRRKGLCIVVTRPRHFKLNPRAKRP